MTSAGIREPNAARNSFARYLVAGAVAAVANYGSRFIFSMWWPFEIAVVLAFVVGLCTGFLLMRAYAFAESQRRPTEQAASYLLVNLLALMQTLAVSSFLARYALPWIGVQQGLEGIAHGAGVLVPVITSYFGHKHLTFR